MGSIVTSNYHGLILLVWIASVLTSPANHEPRTDGTAVTQVSNISSDNLPSESDQHRLLSTKAQLASQSVNSLNALTKNVGDSSVMGEGGPISILPTVQTTLPVVSRLTNAFESPNAKEVTLREKGSDSTPVMEKSTQPKILPRKGAIQEDSDAEKASLLSDKTHVTLRNDIKPVVELTSTTETIHINEARTNVGESIPKLNTSVKNSSESSNANASVNETTVIQTKMPNSTTLRPSPTTRRHKPKPTATIGDGNDKPIPASPAKSPPLGMPRKIDYIVPVVITIISVPLLGTAMFILYRRGRDCWDKRHYRRMDFLIDGMYND